jgi:nucleotidyltransferase/DNA polymerase involved in DNA repair
MTPVAVSSRRTSTNQVGTATSRMNGVQSNIPPPALAPTAQLAASLADARATTEKVSHIGWYISNKRTQQQVQYIAAIHQSPQMQVRLEEQRRENEIHPSNSQHTIAASSDGSIIPALPSPARSSPSSAISSASSISLFAGVCVHINGYTNPNSDTLRALLYAHGGRSENVLVPGVTHWVASVLPATKIKEILSQPKHKPVVTPEWITQSVRRGIRLPESDFELPQLKGRIQRLSFTTTKHSDTQPDSTSKFNSTTTFAFDTISSHVAMQSDSLPACADAPTAVLPKSSSAVISSPFAAPTGLIRRAERARRSLLLHDINTSATTPISFAALSSNTSTSVATPLTAAVNPSVQSSVITPAVAAVLAPPEIASAIAPAPPPPTPHLIDIIPLTISSDHVPFDQCPPISPSSEQDFTLYDPPTSSNSSMNLEIDVSAEEEEENREQKEESEQQDQLHENELVVLEGDNEEDDDDGDDDAAMVAALEAIEEQARIQRQTTADQPSTSTNASIVPNPTAAPPSSALPAASSSSSSRAALLAAASAIGFHVHARSTLTDPDFVPIFFQQSRLHFLGSWKKHFETLLPALQLIHPKIQKQQTVNGAGAAASLLFASAASSSTAASVPPNPNKDRVVLHCDMDCFFVSVAIRDEPHLANEAVVVCHSKAQTGFGGSNNTNVGTGNGNGNGWGGGVDVPNGNGGGSNAEISSASYAARAVGIGAGMRLGHAQELCPNLFVRPYNFESIIAASEELYRVLFSFTHHVQSVSCDEAYIEFPPGTDGVTLASEIRTAVLTRTGCPCSVGIGPNMLLARVATTKAKPNGLFHIRTMEHGKKLLHEYRLKELVGVGWALAKRLDELGLRTCGDVITAPNVTRAWLQQQLGMKTGEMIWSYCNGIDTRPLTIERANKKTIGADVNYGLRFMDAPSVAAFITQVSAEVIKRMRVYRVRGYLVTVRAKKRRAGAPMETPYKFLGHGVCDNYSKSMQVRTAINGTHPSSVAILARNAHELYTTFGIIPTDLRGFGISIGNLETAPPIPVTDDTTAMTPINANAGTLVAAVPQSQHAESVSIVVASRYAPTTAQERSEQHAIAATLPTNTFNATAATTIYMDGTNVKHPSPSKPNTSLTLRAPADSTVKELSAGKSAPQRNGSTNNISSVVQSNSTCATGPTMSTLEVIASAPAVTSPPVPFASGTVSVSVPVPTTVAVPFVWDPVEKLKVAGEQSTKEQLSIFPPFTQLDKRVISHLPVDIRKELADIYKLIRARETNAAPSDIRTVPTITNQSLEPPRPALLQHSPSPPPPAPFNPRTSISATKVSAHGPPTVELIANTVQNDVVTAVDRSPSIRENNSSISTAVAPVASHPTTTAPNTTTTTNVVRSPSEDELEWSQVDQSVLAELPESIQSELKAAARRRKQAQLVTLAPSVQHAGKKRKGSSAASSGNHAGTSSSMYVSSDKPVQVLNIAAMFQQMEKRQRRNNNSIATIKQPSAVTSFPLVQPTLLVSRPIGLNNDEGVQLISSTRAPTISAPVASSLITADPFAHAAMSAPLPKGFIRVDPRANPHRYAQAMAGLPPLPPRVTPTAPPLAGPVSVGSIDDGGVTAMDIDLDSPFKQESTLDQSIDIIAAAATCNLVSSPPIPSPPSVPAVTADVDSEIEDHQESVASSALSTYISFSEIRPWLHEWIRHVATPPRCSHVQLLEQWCIVQLRKHRNLSAVAGLLEYVQWIAEGECTLLGDDQQRMDGQTWRPAFNHLIQQLYPITIELFGGNLHFQSFT